MGKRPRILIIGTHRSGTTNLSKALKLTFSCNKLGEPWNQDINEYKLGPGAEPFPYPDGIKPYSIVKTLIQHLPINWNKGHIEFYNDITKYFDKTIVLTRRNLVDMAMSFEKAKEIGHWHTEYVIEDPSKYDLRLNYHQWCQELTLKVAKSINKPVTWYEELYSGDVKLFNKEVDKWGIELDRNLLFKYFNPENRLRKFIPKKTLI